MKAIVWTCDRCGLSAERPYRTVIVEDYSPKAVRAGFEPEKPADWWGFSDDESVIDVCPNCTTAGERADQLLSEAASAVMFDPGGEA